MLNFKYVIWVKKMFFIFKLINVSVGSEFLLLEKIMYISY